MKAGHRLLARQGQGRRSCPRRSPGRSNPGRGRGAFPPRTRSASTSARRSPPAGPSLGPEALTALIRDRILECQAIAREGLAGDLGRADDRGRRSRRDRRIGRRGFCGWPDSGPSSRFRPPGAWSRPGPGLTSRHLGSLDDFANPQRRARPCRVGPIDPSAGPPGRGKRRIAMSSSPQPSRSPLDRPGGMGRHLGLHPQPLLRSASPAAARRACRSPPRSARSATSPSGQVVVSGTPAGGSARIPASWPSRPQHLDRRHRQRAAPGGDQPAGLRTLDRPDVQPVPGGAGPIPNPWRPPGSRGASTAVPPVNNPRASQP